MALLRGALVAVLATGLAACTDDPEKAGTLPTSSPTTSATQSSPTPDTPEEQVEAAVRAYYAELTQAAQTNETAALKSMMTKGCPCYRAAKVIDRNKRQGEATPDAQFSLTFVRVHDVEQGSALAEVKTRDAAYEVVSPSGEVVDRVEAQTTHLDLSLVLAEDGTWDIGNWFNLAG